MFSLLSHVYKSIRTYRMRGSLLSSRDYCTFYFTLLFGKLARFHWLPHIY